jgi:hypothetical protein
VFVLVPAAYAVAIMLSAATLEIEKRVGVGHTQFRQLERVGADRRGAPAGDRRAVAVLMVR